MGNPKETNGKARRDPMGHPREMLWELHRWVPPPPSSASRASANSKAVWARGATAATRCSPGARTRSRLRLTTKARSNPRRVQRLPCPIHRNCQSRPVLLRSNATARIVMFNNSGFLALDLNSMLLFAKRIFSELQQAILQ